MSSGGKSVGWGYLEGICLGVAGALSGFVNGFLGTGGGIVTVFALGLCDKLFGTPSQKDEGERTRDRFAQTVAIMLVTSAVSAVFYGVGGNIPFRELPVYALPGIAGGALGAFLLRKIDPVWLKRIFAALVIYAGITMIRK